MEGLKGKAALITGASRGIGKAIAIRLAKDGCNIAINDIEPMKEEAQKTAEEIRALGVEAVAVCADVSRFDEVSKMAEELKGKFAQVHILVNNAGITKDRTLKKMSEDEWNDVIRINLNSIFNVTRNLLEMIPDGGSIINMASIAGISGNFGQCNYAASKAGMIGFTKSLAKELGKRKINVNAVAPGFIKSKMTDKIPIVMMEQILELIPFREVGTVEDVANCVAFLASDDARYISGQTIRVDGGITF